MFINLLFFLFTIDIFCYISYICFLLVFDDRLLFSYLFYNVNLSAFAMLFLCYIASITNMDYIALRNPCV